MDDRHGAVVDGGNNNKHTYMRLLVWMCWQSNQKIAEIFLVAAFVNAAFPTWSMSDTPGGNVGGEALISVDQLV